MSQSLGENAARIAAWTIMANNLLIAGESDKAETAYKNAIAEGARLLGMGHPMTRNAIAAYSMYLKAVGRNDKYLRLEAALWKTSPEDYKLGRALGTIDPEVQTFLDQDSGPAEDSVRHLFRPRPTEGKLRWVVIPGSLIVLVVLLYVFVHTMSGGHNKSPHALPQATARQPLSSLPTPSTGVTNALPLPSPPLVAPSPDSNPSGNTDVDPQIHWGMSMQEVKQIEDASPPGWTLEPNQVGADYLIYRHDSAHFNWRTCYYFTEEKLVEIREDDEDGNLPSAYDDRSTEFIKKFGQPISQEVDLSSVTVRNAENFQPIKSVTFTSPTSVIVVVSYADMSGEASYSVISLDKSQPHLVAR